jgi:hypothetical protein
MKMPWSNLEGAAKVLAICGAVLLVSSGLCGLQWVIVLDAGGGGEALVNFIMALGIIELAAIAGSIVVGAVAFFIWATGAVTKRAKPGNAPNLGRPGDLQTLFPREKPPQDGEDK